MLLLNLSQTAYFDGLTLPDCRKWYCDSTGLNIIFIRAIGCPDMPGEGRPTEGGWLVGWLTAQRRAQRRGAPCRSYDKQKFGAVRQASWRRRRLRPTIVFDLFV